MGILSFADAGLNIVQPKGFYGLTKNSKGAFNYKLIKLVILRIKRKNSILAKILQVRALGES